MKIEPQLHLSDQPLWITILLFSCFVLLSMIQFASPKKLPSLVSGFFSFSPKTTRGISLEGVGMFFIFICSVSLLSIKLLPSLSKGFGINMETIFTVSVLFVLSYYCIKSILLLLTGFIFEELPAAREYNREIFLFTHVAGLIFLPFAVFVTYINIRNIRILSEILLSFISILLIYRTIKMIFILSGMGIKVFYLFLYLCILEILPFALIIKYIYYKI
jgi:hypothetical protein